MKKVLFTGCSMSDNQIDVLKEHGIEIVKTGEDLDQEDLISKLQDCAGYVVGGTDKATAAVIESTHLEIINFHGTAYENYIDVDTATKHNIVVANTPQANAYTVAEYTVALILNCVKRITDSNNETKSGAWARNRLWNLEGKTLGIVGMGTIGQYVATILKKAFNMQILYVSRSAKQAVESEHGAQKVSLEELFKTT